MMFTKRRALFLGKAKRREVQLYEPFKIEKGKDPKRINGGIAQLGEHLLCKQGVIGSIPIISTNLGL